MYEVPAGGGDLMSVSERRRRGTREADAPSSGGVGRPADARGGGGATEDVSSRSQLDRRVPEDETHVEPANAKTTDASRTARQPNGRLGRSKTVRRKVATEHNSARIPRPSLHQKTLSGSSAFVSAPLTETSEASKLRAEDAPQERPGRGALGRERRKVAERVGLERRVCLLVGRQKDVRMDRLCVVAQDALARAVREVELLWRARPDERCRDPTSLLAQELERVAGQGRLRGMAVARTRSRWRAEGGKGVMSAMRIEGAQGKQRKVRAFLVGPCSSGRARLLNGRRSRLLRLQGRATSSRPCGHCQCRPSGRPGQFEGRRRRT